MSKIKKLIKDPMAFFRDYFNKRAPFVYNELKINLNVQAEIMAKELEICSYDINQLKIDVVYTWVDHTDPIWLDKFNYYRAQPCVADPLHGMNAARFTNHDELRYSILSIKKFMPWVNHIFIITDNQIPGWFKNDDNISIVDHSEIIDKSYLPTFNSHVIEANLHKINALSEYFIYFNDDVFVARFLPRSHFFKGNGLASLFLGKVNTTLLIPTQLKKTATFFATENSQALLKKLFNVNVNRRLIHTYVPLRKQTQSQLEYLFHDEIQAFQLNKFRATNDLNIATFLGPWISYFKGLAYPNIDICYYFNIRSNAANSFYQCLLSIKNNIPPYSFCANDFYTNNTNQHYKNEFVNFLKKYFEVDD